MSNSAFTPYSVTLPGATSSGSGQGEINVVTNPSATTDATKWTASVPANLSRDSSGSPLDPVVPTGFSILSTAIGQTLTSESLTVPASLRNRKLKLEFYMTQATAAFKVDVLNSSGTRFSLTTDASGVTNLPALSASGKFTTYFDMDSGNTIQVRFTSILTSGTLKFTQVIVGPGIQPQGAVVGEWTTFGAATVGAVTTAPTKGTVSRDVMQYQRVGSTMHLRWDYNQTVAGSAGSGIYLISLPTGLTLDTSKIPADTNPNSPGRLGRAWIVNDINSLQGELYAYSSTQVAIRGLQDVTGYSNFSSNSAVNFSNASLLISVYDAILPIAEWAGSGTVQLAQNDNEYVANNGTNNIYGPAGTAFPTTTTAAVTRTVTFQTPIQDSDQVILEWRPTMSSQWMSSDIMAEHVSPTQWAAYNTTAETGWGELRQSSSTQVVVVWRRYRNGTINWAGSSDGYWRVRKSSAGAAVGFGIVQPGVSSGLVSASGLPGNTTGNAIASGYVGELPTATTLANLTNAGGNAVWTKHGSSFTPAAGLWRIKFTGSARAINAQSTGMVFAGIVIDSETTPPAGSISGGGTPQQSSLSTNVVTFRFVAERYISSTGTTTVSCAMMGDLMSAAAAWTLQDIRFELMRIA